MKKIVSLFVVLMCVVGLVACGKKSAVIGTWTDMDGYNIMEFNEKTGRMMSGSQEVGFNYTINDKTISADMGFMVDVMDYSLSKVDGIDCLKMKINGENFTFYRKDDIGKIKPAENKVKETSAKSNTKVEEVKTNDNAINENEFFGRWINEEDSGEQISFVLQAGYYAFLDGSCSYFLYNFDKENITFDFKDISIKTYPYKIENNKLFIEYDGKKHTYIKIEDYFKKMKSNESISETSLIGQWIEDIYKDEIIDFIDEKTGNWTIGEYPAKFAYEKNNENIIWKFNNRTDTYPIKLESKNNKLKLFFDFGDNIEVYTKQ